MGNETESVIAWLSLNPFEVSCLVASESLTKLLGRIEELCMYTCNMLLPYMGIALPAHPQQIPLSVISWISESPCACVCVRERESVLC